MISVRSKASVLYREVVLLWEGPLWEFPHAVHCNCFVIKEKNRLGHPKKFFRMFERFVVRE